MNVIGGEDRPIRRGSKVKAIGTCWLILFALAGILNLALPSHAATNEDEGRWFIGVLNTHNGKEFCIPAGKPPIDVAKDFKNYLNANNLPDRFTELGAIQVLNRVYPCAGGQNIGSKNLSQLGGRTVTVQPTGVYAAIDTKPMIVAIQRLNATVTYENDGFITTIERNSGDYAPPVLFALAQLLFRQGRTHDALFWLNAGRVRGMFDAARCTDISARSAVSLLISQMPRELIKAQFDDSDRMKETLERVLQWDERTPYTYDHRWINLHGMDSMTASLGNQSSPTGPLTVPSDTWPALAKKTRENFHADFLKMMEKVRQQTAKAAATP